MRHEIHFPVDAVPLVYVADHGMDSSLTPHPDRIMPSHVLLYVMQGMFSVVEDGQEYFIHQGHLLFLHAGIRHYGIHPCSPRKWAYIHFAPKPAYADDFSIADIPVSKNIEFSERDFHCNIVLPKTLHDENRTIERSVCEIVTMFASRDPLRQIRCSIQLYSLLLQISNTAKEAMKPRYSIHIEKLISHIENHLDWPIRSEDISNQFQLNYRYLSTLFKKETGMTIHSFQRMLRINKACKLLRYTAMNIQQVGTSVGYPDLSHFSHVFKAIKGVAPKEYLMESMQMLETAE